MGTNYYWYPSRACGVCGQGPDPLHIGKSSGGWAFLLHVIPEEGLNSLFDWEVKWAAEGSYIQDEYGMTVSPDEMLLVITARHHNGGPVRRHDIDGACCIEHGPGTWDCCLGEFS